MGAPKGDRKRSRNETDNHSPNSFEDRDNGAVQASKRARVEERRSLFVRSLPPGTTNESLADFFSQHYPVKHAVVVVDQKTKESKGFGFVTFADADDAQEAKKSLNNQEWNGKRLRIDVAEPRHRNGPAGEPIPGKPQKKEEFQPLPKLIVRNLPWSVKTSEQLGHLFRSFGKVKYADLPQTKGKLKGFGFVTIRGKKNAERALEAINGKEIDGRTLAVDWAVDKTTWDKQQPQEKGEEDTNDDDEEDATSSKDESGDEDQDEDEDEDEDQNEDQEAGGAKVSRDSQLDADLENFMKNHFENLEEEDDDKDDEDEQKEVQKRPQPKRMTDNSATVFIRNLPFTSTDEQLQNFFGHFGKVRYARVVVDKVTEKPAGTAFVCFYNIEDAQNCIKAAPRCNQPVTTTKSSILQDEAADPDGKYTLDGRLLQVAQAVDKQQASNLADNSLAKRNQKDKRNLFLLNEGSIDRSSPLFNLLSLPEVQARQSSAAQRKKQVQNNPSLHLSLTRLALRNIPRNIDSKELKELARKAVVEFAMDVRAGRRQPLSKEENARDGPDAKEKEHDRKVKRKGIIKQAKVVFESSQGTKTQEKDGGRSRGYGFVEYTSHHWALMGLRYLNGYQLDNDHGKKQRLIAEFAIENAQVVQRRRANEERSRQMQPNQDQKGPEAQAAGSRPGPEIKTLAKAKGKGKARGRKGAEPATAEARRENDGLAKDPKAEMQQTLIARKRQVRKKKAQIRGKK